jgi:hypothetical protein
MYGCIDTSKTMIIKPPQKLVHYKSCGYSIYMYKICVQLLCLCVLFWFFCFVFDFYVRVHFPFQVGAAISMTYITGQPIVFVGTGQTYTDLRNLNAKAVVNSLLKA